MNIQTKRQITLVYSNMRAGGIERLILNLTSEFLKNGLAVSLILKKAHGEYLNDLDPAVDVIDLGSSNPFLSFPRLLLALSRLKPASILTFSTLNHLT
ncbi:MAG: hypothetical protein U1B80_03205, partial [Anaerolineaceae bacterium]|nr:hypothetical protein [Anaerolineaceae bacterium]